MLALRVSIGSQRRTGRRDEHKVTTMKLYSITNRTSSLHLGAYPGRTADEALDAYYSDAGYSCRVGAARALETTVEALLADLIVAEYDYADDLKTLVAEMIDCDRDGDRSFADMSSDDLDASNCDHWARSGLVYAVAELAGLSRATVDAIGWPAIRDAYAAAWRAAVELELASRDEVAS